MMSTVGTAVGASLVVLCALAACAALRRRSAALRHMVLAAGIFSGAAVAPLSLVLPRWNVAVSSPASATHAAADQEVPVRDPAIRTVAQEATATQPPAGDVVIGIIAAGAAFGLVMLAVALTRLAFMTAAAARVTDDRWLEWCVRLSAAYGLKRPAALLQTSTPHMIAAWGIRRPCVLLPSDAGRWDESRIRVVLAHELAHVRRRDWLVQTGADVVRSVFWFNPLFWVACRRLRRESEEACDDAVLAMGEPPARYAAELVEIARTRRQSFPTWASALPIARPSSLERRIAAMLNATHDRRPPTRRALAITSASLLALTVAASAARISAQTSPLPVTGHVYDASGGLLPQVALTVEGAGVAWQATTDAAGRFEFPPTASGKYTLSASLAGFRPLQYDLVLQHPRDWQRAITLQVATVRESIVVTDRRRPGRAAVIPTAPSPLRVGGNIRAPLKTVDIKPIYPESMRDLGLEGTVPIDAVIGTDGAVASVRVVSAQVHPDFAIAAIDAVRQWRFTPTLLNGKPVEIVMTVTVQFSLTE